MERYANGDGPAFDELFGRYEPRAFAYFLKRTRCPDRAQDLYQELFLRVHRARHVYDPRRAFAPWFFQIAHRLLVDDVRRAYRSQEIGLDEEPACAPRAAATDCVAEREHLARILGELSDCERFVLVSAQSEGVGYPELAARLGKSVEAVRKIASRAAQRLRSASLARPASSAPLAR